MVNKKLFFLILFLLIFIPVVIFILSKLSNTNNKITTADALKPIIRIIENPFEKDLEKIVKYALIDKDEKYGVFIKDLKNGDTYSYNGNYQFESASLYKIWVMGASFGKIKEGKILESEVLEGNPEDFDKILSEVTPTPTINPPLDSKDDESQENKEVSYTALEAIERMITVSDNYAALLVASRAGSFAVTNFLKEYEFKNSSFRQPPKTIALDIGKYFEKLYKGEIVNADYSEEMIEILKKQTINDRIPKYLPANISVAHKTGELGEFKHDAGIVFTKKGDYIIVVLSKTKDPYATAEKIANFSKNVYNYFQKTR